MYTGPSWSTICPKSLRSCTLSTGSHTTMPGMLRMMAMSSKLMCVPPLSSAHMPGSLPTIFTFMRA